jgi:hypothetical protein
LLQPGDLAKRDRFIVIPSHALKHDVVGTLAEEPLAAQRKTTESDGYIRESAVYESARHVLCE